METRRRLHRKQPILAQSFFTNDGNPFYDGREMVVKIFDHVIKFSFKERRNGEFYSIPLKDFKTDAKYWIDHMKKKSWFTDEMEEFISQETNNPIL